MEITSQPKPSAATWGRDDAYVGVDLAKNVFQVHGADGAGRAVLRKKLRRTQVLEFFSQLPPCVVAMEACGGAHFWAREIGKLGHVDKWRSQRRIDVMSMKPKKLSAVLS